MTTEQLTADIARVIRDRTPLLRMDEADAARATLAQKLAAAIVRDVPLVGAAVEMREALQPLADHVARGSNKATADNTVGEPCPDWWPVGTDCYQFQRRYITFGDCRRAAAVLSKLPKE